MFVISNSDGSIRFKFEKNLQKKFVVSDKFVFGKQIKIIEFATNFQFEKKNEKNQEFYETNLQKF